MGQTDSGHAYAETEQISYRLSYGNSELSNGQPAFRLSLWVWDRQVKMDNWDAGVDERSQN